LETLEARGERLMQGCITVTESTGTVDKDMEKNKKGREKEHKKKRVSKRVPKGRNANGPDVKQKRAEAFRGGSGES